MLLAPRLATTMESERSDGVWRRAAFVMTGVGVFESEANRAGGLGFGRIVKKTKMVVVRNRHVITLRRTNGRHTEHGRNDSVVVPVVRAQTREFRLEIFGVFGQFKLPATIAEPDYRIFKLILWRPDKIGVAVVINIFGEQATVTCGRSFEMQAARLRIAKSDVYAFVHTVRPDLRLIREMVLIEISAGLRR